MKLIDLSDMLHTNQIICEKDTIAFAYQMMDKLDDEKTLNPLKKKYDIFNSIISYIDFKRSDDIASVKIFCHIDRGLLNYLDDPNDKKHFNTIKQKLKLMLSMKDLTLIDFVELLGLFSICELRSLGHFN